jgi:hypothetical protein
MKILGHCRFSFFGTTDTGREIGTLEDARARLWEPRRMAVRFHLFEHLLLPAIRAQTDQDFTLLLITSRAMPDVFHARLSAITNDQPNIRILATDQTDYTRAALPVTQELSRDLADPLVHFRVDDDDGLSRDYIARLRDAVGRVDPGGMITFPRGVMGMVDGQVARHTRFNKMSIAIGLAIISTPGSRIHPFRIQHGRHASRVPSYCDPTFDAYHYSLHSANISANAGNGAEPTFRTDGERNKRILAARAELAEKGDGFTTPEIEDIICQAFPFTDGARLREVLAATADPAQLAQSMGFV